MNTVRDNKATTTGMYVCRSHSGDGDGGVVSNVDEKKY